MQILNKKDMSEEDIKLNYITPAIQSRGWNHKITMETAVKFTDGKVNLYGNVALRSAPKQADTNVQTFFIPKRHGLSSYQRQKKANYIQ